MSFTELLKQRVDANFQKRVEDTLAESGTTEADRLALVDYLKGKCAAVVELADTLSAPEDEHDLYQSASLFWLELRSEWLRYNQIMNYQMMQKGAPEPLVHWKGTVSSEVLAALEELLLSQDVERLGLLSMEPLAVTKLVVQSVNRFLAHSEKQVGHIGRVFAAASAALATTSELKATNSPDIASEPLDGLSERYERFLEQLSHDTDEAMKVRLDVFWPVLTEAVEGAAVALGRRAQVADHDSSDTKIDLRITRTIESVAAASTTFLLQNGGAPPESGEARTSHARITVQVAPTEDVTTLRIGGDAKSRIKSRSATDGAVADAWKSLAGEIESKGALAALEEASSGESTIVVSIPSSGLSSGEHFLVLDGTSPPICIPARYLKESPAGDGASVETIDLRSDHASPRAEFRVTLPSGRSVVVVGTGKATDARGIAVPTTSVDDTQSGTFALSFLSSHGAVGMLDERAFRALSKAKGQQAAA